MEKWDDFRLKKEKAIKLYIKVRKVKLRAVKIISHCKASIAFFQLFRVFDALRTRRVLEMRMKWGVFRITFAFKRSLKLMYGKESTV